MDVHLITLSKLKKKLMCMIDDGGKSTVTQISFENEKRDAML